MNTFLPVFLIGVAGSLHCLGMCSPLVMTVSRMEKRPIIRNLFYNSGRILTYSILGSAVSFLGEGFALMGVQQWVSITVGILLLFIGMYNVSLRLPVIFNKQVLQSINFLKSRFCKIASNAGHGGTLLLGMINGLLPCGLSLAALTYCVTLSWPTDGFLAMLFFGLGTLPAMTGLAIMLKAFIEKFRLSYQTIQTSLLIVSAVLLIARGAMGFGGTHAGDVHSPNITVCGSNR